MHIKREALSIKIGVFHRDFFGETNLSNMSKLSNLNSLNGSTIQPVNIDWRYKLTDDEKNKFINQYKNELNATTIILRDPLTKEIKEQKIPLEKQEELLKKAEQSYLTQTQKNLDEAVDDYLKDVDAIYVPGIGYNPSQEYCVENINKVEAAMGGADLIEPDKRREKFEIALVKKAKEKGIPVLGICAGSWLVAECFAGGKTDVLPMESDAYFLNDQVGEVKINNDGIRKARLQAHSAHIMPNTMLGGIVKNASRWTPTIKENKLQKTLQRKNIHSNEVVLTIHDKQAQDENNLSEGYHLIKQDNAWKLIYRKRDVVNLLENNNEIKLVSVPIGLDLIPEMEDKLKNQSYESVVNQKKSLQQMLSDHLLVWINSTHWRVVVAQDPETGKIDNHNHLIITALEPTHRTIEAFETRFGVPIIGIQWHPELTIPEWITSNHSVPNPEFSSDRRILEAFAESALTYARKRLLLSELEKNNEIVTPRLNNK